MASNTAGASTTAPIARSSTAMDDAMLGHLVPGHAPVHLTAPQWHQGLVMAVAILVVVLSWWPARNLVSRRQRMNLSFNPLHLVNTYGAFGSITRERYEIVLEGTDEAPDSATAAWKEYEFNGKPGDPSRRPPQVAPYHMRLDWLMWFAAMSNASDYPWFASLMLKVLEGESQQTLAKQLLLFHERALPDLARNIKCGNSLIGPDFYEGQQAVLFDEDEIYRINVFDWNAASAPAIAKWSRAAGS